MELVHRYAPYVLIVCGLAGATLPVLAGRLRGWLSRLSGLRAAPAQSSLELKRNFVEAVIGAMDTCQQAGCQEGVDTAKRLLTFVDQINGPISGPVYGAVKTEGGSNA